MAVGAASPATVADSAAAAPGEAVRLRLDLAYDGRDFHGWAPQPGLRTVAGVLSSALATTLRSGCSPALVVAGRTDAGVHALGQVCHVDVAPDAFAAAGAATGLTRRLRGLLPPDVRLTALVVAPRGFDARFAARRRRYAYRVCDDPAGPDPLRRHEVLTHPRPLTVARMTEASARLRGFHDFAAFCKRRDGATTIRTLEEFFWARDADGTVRAGVVADAFCHSMVRALVGCLLPVGDGRRDVGWPAQVLAARLRDPAVTVAPAHGLTLIGIDYPPDEQLAERVREARAMRAAV